MFPPANRSFKLFADSFTYYPFIYSGGELQITANPAHLKLFVVIVTII